MSETRATARGPDGAGGDQRRVTLAVAHDENRALLRDWFEERGFAVERPAGAAAFDAGVDLVVMDPAGYEHNEERLDSLKAAAPAFLPYLLVAGDDRAREDPEVWDRVDDVMVTPLSTAELDGRVSALLERRSLSVELAAETHRFRTLFQATPDPVVAADESRTVVDVNAAFCRLLDTTREACVGRRIDELPGLAPAVSERLRAALDNELGAEGRTIEFTDADGERRVADLAVAGDDGYCVAVLRDVTEQVARRTELERQNRRLDDFADALAHGLRTPLNLVEGHLRDAELDEEVRATVTDALAEMDARLSDLLTLSRDGEVVGALRSVAFGPLVDDAWAELSADATLSRPDELPRLRADPERLQEALVELFENAVVHGGRSVTVEVLDDGFAVVDDGPGVAEGGREAAFEPGHTTAEGRTGFGLSIVRQIAEAHGWSVALEPADGGGTRVAVRGVALADDPEDGAERASGDVTRDVSPGEGRPAETLQTSVFYLQRLYAATAGEGDSFEERLDAVLDLGRQRFGLPYGFLTRIEDGTQEIVRARGDHELLQTGESCPLNEAYCRKTLDADGLLGVQDALAEGWQDDPAYDTFELGAYLGARVTVDGELYGTLCFAASSPRETPFSEAERTFLELAAGWVGNDIARRRHRAELRRQVERLDEFASVVSHDLRNPLTVAQGNVEVAREAGESAALADAAAALDRMERLIEDVLALAREGEVVDDPAPFALTDAAEAAWASVAAPDASLTVAGDVALRGDPDRVEQLLGNLFRNAVEHGGEGVAVEVGALAGGGFYVADDGPGIPEADREEVLESGYTTDPDGTGFGLSIVRTISEAHGWTVTVTEGESGGARFEFRTGD